MRSAACLLLAPGVAHAAGAGAVGENLLWLALILLSARLFAPLAQRLGFPAVLGELLHRRRLGRDDLGQATRIGFGTWLGLALGIGLKVGLAGLMLGLFAVAWIF